MKNKVKEELDKVLSLFDEAGFLTHKGTNSYVIANILVDYTQRVLNERLRLQGYLNYWETSDISVITRLAYERYRIYNPRSSAEVYRVNEERNIGETYWNAVHISPLEVMVANSRVCALGNPKSLNKPISLKIPYNDLLSYSVCYKSATAKKLKSPDYFESFMSSDGEYVERDYVILPDDDGNAQFIPLRDFTKERAQSIHLLLFLRKGEEFDGQGEKIRAAREITPNYLRLVTTELFSKFAIFNKMSINSLAKFLKLQYNQNVYISKASEEDESVLWICLPAAEREELRAFLNKNVAPPYGKEWRVKHPAILKVFSTVNTLPLFLTKEELKKTIKTLPRTEFELQGKEEIILVSRSTPARDAPDEEMCDC